MKPTHWLRAAVLVVALAPQVQAQDTSLRKEIETLHAGMLAAFKSDPATVSRFYTDDASILGGGGRYVGREQIDQYWRQGSGMIAEWNLEVLEVGGDSRTPWVRGRSTILGKSGGKMVTEYIGLLKRQPDGQLGFYVDMFVAASPAMAPRPPEDDPATRHTVEGIAAAVEQNYGFPDTGVERLRPCWGPSRGVVVRAAPGCQPRR